MLGHDQLYDESRDARPFANSTEGYGWFAANCETCIHDKPARRGDEGNGCPLILLALVGRTPAQWLDGPRDENGLYSIAGQYTCIEYRHENDGPADPRPVPTPPGQGELFGRDGFEGHRMLTALPKAVVSRV